MKLTVAVGLICLALGWVICKQWPTPPAGPSRDSTRAVNIDSMLGRGVARADSSVAASRPAVARIKTRGDSIAKTVQAELDSTRRTTPPIDQAAATDYWHARALSAEALLDLNIEANKVIEDSLANGWKGQIEETARLSALVAAAQDSIALLTISIGAKDRALARANRACQLGTVNGGWSPLTGKADLTIGGSCEVIRLVRSVL